jgi:hypothetical protein
MSRGKPESEYEFWFRDGHGLMRRPSGAGPFDHPEIWNGRRWMPGSAYDLDALTGMGEDPWSCGEFADRWDLNRATEYAAAHGIDLYAKDPDPAPSAEWEVWYRDTFDRECPPQIEVRGRGFVNGFIELWARHLAEGVDGFSQFSLLRKDEYKLVVIEGDRQGLARIRTWVFGNKDFEHGYVEAAEKVLLEDVAIAHARLTVAGKSSATLVEFASAPNDRETFAKQIKNLAAE